MSMLCILVDSNLRNALNRWMLLVRMMWHLWLRKVVVDQMSLYGWFRLSEEATIIFSWSTSMKSSDLPRNRHWIRQSFLLWSLFAMVVFPPYQFSFGKIARACTVSFNLAPFRISIMMGQGSCWHGKPSFVFDRYEDTFCQRLTNYCFNAHEQSENWVMSLSPHPLNSGLIEDAERVREWVTHATCAHKHAHVWCYNRNYRRVVINCKDPVNDVHDFCLRHFWTCTHRSPHESCIDSKSSYSGVWREHHEGVLAEVELVEGSHACNRQLQLRIKHCVDTFIVCHDSLETG